MTRPPAAPARTRRRLAVAGLLAVVALTGCGDSAVRAGAAATVGPTRITTEELTRLVDVGLSDPAAAERATGYVVGGISPIGQKGRIPVVVDASAEGFETVYVSAGKRGLQVELAPADLVRAADASVAAIAAP